MKKVEAKSKEERQIQESSLKTINQQIMDLPSVSMNHVENSNDNNGKEEESGSPLSTTPLLENCANCAQCISKIWITQITREYILQFEQHLYMMKQFYAIHSPLSNVNEEMELYPGTNVRLPKKLILLAIAKANNNPRAMVRNLFLNIIPEKQLVKYQTADELSRLQPNIQLAITEYLKINQNVKIPNTTYIDIINKKMHHLKTMSKMMPNEVERSLALKRDRVRELRMKRKLQQKNDSVSKIPKTKTAANDQSSQVEEPKSMIQKDAICKHPTPDKNSNETPSEAGSSMPPKQDNFSTSKNPQQYPYYHGYHLVLILQLHYIINIIYTNTNHLYFISQLTTTYHRTMQHHFQDCLKQILIILTIQICRNNLICSLKINKRIIK